jgi:hypothetical protein|tara:strand:+ start:3575 stop:3781 length:207 start_codon:yes stop_codon:yes gene_type:complete
MVQNKTLPSAADTYDKEEQDALVKALEDSLFEISTSLENVSFGKSSAISLYSKRELLLIPKLGIESIT